jgi:uncharacterized protein (DUF697 family)
MKILEIYDKVERVVSKLPEPLQKPILKEISPIKDLFLLQRAPRLVLLGEAATGRMQFINALFNAEALTPADERTTTTGWHEIARIGKGRLQLLDARAPADIGTLQNALVAQPPDLFVYLRSHGQSPDAFEADLDHAAAVLRAGRAGSPPTVLGLLLGGDPADDLARQRFHSGLHSRAELSAALKTTVALPHIPDASLDALALEHDRLADVITNQLPVNARLEMARLSGARSVQTQIAGTLIKSTTAVCAAIGAQPIPLADFPILTGLQVGMVTGIMYISGRDLNARLAAEFLAAVGANIGAALMLREGARAALKFVPFWGNAVSGAIAGAGTYAMGKSASSYFIGGASLQEARRSFRRWKTDAPRLKR